MTDLPMRILVVDDDPTVRTWMRASLRKAGYEVTLAAGGQEGLRQFRESGCDMVMLDVDMPHLDGYTLCTTLRKEAGELLPIVMVTGMDDVRSVERAYHSGATDFIAKPINWALIGHRVRYLFRVYSAQRDLRAVNARHAALLNAIPDTLLRVDASGLVLEAGPLPWAESLSDPSRWLADQMREAREQQHLEFSLPDVASSTRHYEARIAPIDDTQAIALVRDITDRKDAERRVTQLAYFDGLTGLPNRRAFLDRLERELARAGVGGCRLGVLFVDLDGFKQVNDTLGHNAGDLILVEAAHRLRSALRPSDLLSRQAETTSDANLARLGGDEFTALIPNIRSAEDAAVVARRVVELMREPFEIEGGSLQLSSSVGIAIYPEDGADVESLLERADSAMYRAKHGGRDSCRLYGVPSEFGNAFP